MTNTDKTKLIAFLISYKINDPISIRIYKRKQNELIDITSIVNITEKTEKIEINIKRYLNLIQETNLKEIKSVNLEGKKTYTEHFNLLYENDTYIVIEYKQIIQSDELFPNLKSYDYNKDKVIKIKDKTNYKIIKDEITFIEITDTNVNIKDLENHIQ
jgi:type III secretory pathway component EscR